MARDTSRMQARHLDRLAAVALLAGSHPEAAPGVREPDAGRFWDEAAAALGDDVGKRLRVRLRTLTAYDWPDSLQTDPNLRRGYTVQQIYRIVTVIALLEANLTSLEAVRIARDNEHAFIRAYASRLHSTRLRETGGRPSDDDLVPVVLGGALTAIMDPDRAQGSEIERVRLVRRSELGQLWSGPERMQFRQATVLDVADAGQAVAMWLTTNLGKGAPLDDPLEVWDFFRRADDTAVPDYRRSDAPLGSRYHRRP